MRRFLFVNLSLVFVVCAISLGGGIGCRTSLNSPLNSGSGGQKPGAKGESSGHKPEPRINFTEQLLVQIPPEHEKIGRSWLLTVNLNKDRVAYAAKRSGKAFVVLDGQAGPEFDEIVYLNFSPDGNRCVYIAKEKGKYCVVVNGREGEFFDDVDAPVFSADGSRIAYRAQRTGTVAVKYFVVTDGVKGAEYDGVGNPVFSQDGRRVAYRVVADDKSSIVVDNEIRNTPNYSWVSNPVFSPDGSQVAYAAKQGKGDDATYFVVVGDERGPRYGGGISEPRFTPDGTKVAYFVRERFKWFVVMGGTKRGPEFDEDGILPIFNHDGSRMAFAGRNDAPFNQRGQDRKKWVVVVDDKSSPEFDDVNHLVFSPDGKRFAYGAFLNGKAFIISDGQKGTEYDGIGRPVFDRNSQQIAYFASEGGKSFIVVGSKRGPSYELIDLAPVFSDDGRRVAYISVQDREVWRRVLEVE